MTKEEFLIKYIYAGLTNLNDGFDAPTIRYFSKSDFQILLDRIEKYGIGILGIEPWPNKSFGGVRTFEESGLKSSDPRWYRQAFQDFIKEGIDSYFAASYSIPDELLK